MSDRFSSSISIGGQVTAEQAKDIIGFVDLELQADWGEPLLNIIDNEGLLKHIVENGCLWFCNEQQDNGGEFEIEQWLLENGIPFTRNTAPTTEYPGDIVEFRAGMGNKNEQVCDSEEHQQMDVQLVREMLNKIESDPSNLVSIMDQFNIDHPTFAALPKFEIVG